MSKKIKILLISILLFVLSVSGVNASNISAELITESTDIKPGETFTVKFKANCDEGINGLISTVKYDQEKLEFVKVEVLDTTKWTNLGEGLEVQMLYLDTETVTEAEVFTLTFKVKDNAEVNSTATVTVDEIILDTEDLTDSTKELGKKEIEFKIVAEEEPSEEPKEESKEEPKEEPKEESKEEPKEESKEEPKNEPKDNTVASKNHPNTGAEKIMFPIITLVIILIGSYIGYKKYKAI